MSNIIVTVIRDLDPTSPREWDNLGTIAYWPPPRARIGDVQPSEDRAEWLAENAPKGSIVIPLYGRDRVGVFAGDPGDIKDGGWDGVIVATPDEIRKCYGRTKISAKIRASAVANLLAEIAAYDSYLSGDVWGYTIESECESCGTPCRDDEISDSCFGFYGDDLDGMRNHVDPEYHAALAEAWDNRS